jgi:hypothetical protein
MKIIKAVLCMLLSCLPAMAATVLVPNTSPEATIQATLNASAPGSTVQVAAGTYNLTTTLSVPAGVVLQGPPVVFPAQPTAVFTSKLPGAAAVALGNGSAMHYIEINTSHPSPDGGLAVYAPAGATVDIRWNYLHGNQANASQGAWDDALIYLDGNANAAVASGSVIAWNYLGASGDCSNVMSNYSYAGLGGDGGYCNSVGIHGGQTGLQVTNNVIAYQEQGIKVFEGQGQCVNCNVAYNDISNTHRIGFETQANTGPSKPTSMTIFYNSIHDQFDPNYGSWGISAANGCASGCNTQTNFNVLIANIQATSAGHYVPGGIEIWGSGSATTQSYNLLQGYWGNALDFSSEGGFVANYNNFCISGGGSTSIPKVGSAQGGFYGNETSNAMPNGPATSVGSTFSTSPTCAQTSVQPAISQGGTFTSPQTVTLTNLGVNRDANTSIWYTLDGSTPVPGAGTAQFYTAPFLVAVTTTVKAVGMWGALNQPKSYAAGYGYVPSAVVSSAYTIAPVPPPAPVITSGYLTTPNNQNTANVGDTIQFTAIGCTAAGACAPVTPTGWLTTGLNPLSGTVTSSGLFQAVAGGSVNVQATLSPTVNSSQWTVNVATPPPPPPPTSWTYVFAPGSYTATIGLDGSITVVGTSDVVPVN